MAFEWTGIRMAQSIGSMETWRDGEINPMMSVHDNPCLVMLGFGVKLVKLVEWVE